MTTTSLTERFDKLFSRIDDDGGGIISADDQSGRSLEDIKAFFQAELNSLVEEVREEVFREKFKDEYAVNYEKKKYGFERGLDKALLIIKQKIK